jgi:L-ribulose-5-phosphate 4-epimerase
MLEQLKEDVFHANLQLVEHRLVSLTWGNVSGVDRQRGYVVIKPSGVSYAEMTADDMVVVDLQGRNIQGNMRPSSDTPTHVALYRAWPQIGGVAHTHSPVATAFAQAGREIPCLGTTHADHFHGAVRVAPALTSDEVEDDYEVNTGHGIIACMGTVPPLELPGILTAHHGPFTWGNCAEEAVHHAIVLEAVARMAMDTFLLNPLAAPIPAHLAEKHFARKHGADAYYGQQGPNHD